MTFNPTLDRHMRKPPSLFALLSIPLALSSAHAGVLQVSLQARDGQPLSDAIVIVEPTGNPAAAAPSKAPVTIEQQRMRFVPAVTVVTRGTALTFTNRDRWDHHVRGVPVGPGAQGGGSRGFELRLAGHSDAEEPVAQTVTLSQTGPYQLGCHLHSSMRGAVYVTDSPWYGKTDAQGVMRLPDVPDGPARIRIWHSDQLLDTAPIETQVEKLTVLSIPTQISPRRRRP